ncbi:hypothetical protein DB347_05500 [Opitutaceae bacterium EW11]|nr:hypothetical protein DB347_05500 [Opitutaceae bacterium EW11]
MNRKETSARYALALLLLAAAPSLRAQTAATPSSTAPAADDETIELSPFTVTATEDKGSYQATATLAGSRIRTELRDVGSAVSVVTGQFLKDTGATNNATLLQYTVSTEVGGAQGNFAGLGDTATLDETSKLMNPQSNTRVRGLSQADNTRDFFLTDIPWDSFNVGRVDLQRGPNAILFGMGAPAGIINASVNGAAFRTSGTAEVRVDNYGTIRGSVDYNHVLLPDELALRISGLDDNTKYRQNPAYQHDQRLYVAGRWDPKFFRTESARTSFEVKFEKGRIRANRPRTLPPGDLITAWWRVPSLSAIRQAGGMSLQTLAAGDTALIEAARAKGDLGAGVRGSNSAYVNKAIGSFGRNYGGIVAVFDDPNSSNGHLMTTDISKTVTSVVTGFPWTIMSGVMTRSQIEGALKTLPNYDFYRDETLKDSSIFDFYNKLLDGPNKHEWSNHEAFNARASQTFFNNRFGIEAVVDQQHVDRGQTNLMSNFGQAITLDMNNTLIDGSKNPNYGKAAIISDQFANNSFKSKRESWRLTSFAELRGDDITKNDTVAKIIGKHVITGLWSSEDYHTETRGWLKAAADGSWGVYINDPMLSSRSVNTLNYLTTSSIAGLSSLSGANIGNLRAVQNPSAGSLTVFDMTWKDSSVDPKASWVNPQNPSDTKATQAQNPANYKGWTTRGIGLLSDSAGDRNALTTNAQLTRTITDSYAGNWQAYFFDGVLVPSAGIRVDKQKSYALNQGQMPMMPDGSRVIDFTSSKYKLPDEPDNIVTGRTKTYSVVLHTPKRIREKIWGNTGISLFFNKSENFQPAAGRIDIVGDSLPSPQGKTKDYGIMIETLDDRLSLRINHYKTTVTNAQLADFGGSYMTWGAEAWAYNFGKANQLRIAAGGWADFTKGYDPLGIVAQDTPAGGWTADQVSQAQAAGDAIVAAYMAHAPSAQWFKLWGINTAEADKGAFIAGNAPAGFTITGDTESKGWEYELNAQPTKNWNIAINAAKTDAQRTNMAGSMVSWVEARWKVYNTPVTMNGQPLMLQIPDRDGGPRQAIIGDLRFWNGGYGAGETLHDKYLREFMSGYWLYRIQEGSNVPELRPWRFNLITNYNFDHGFLKGVNVGGGYRWEDKQVVGYPVLPGATLSDPRSFDLAHPYKAKSQDAIDLWVGYSRKITRKLEWRVQLNVRNIFGSDDLIPVTVQPDGSVAVGRIPEPTVWTLTNTVSF